ncbi:copper fist DNA binding domain-containing protein [Mucor lusitanicus]
MLINGEKWACATHCKHTDRKLISIKKKGRPATQCKRCRELRVLRQLHVKCDKKSSNSNANPSLSSVESLRPLAPKLSESKGCCNSSKSMPSSSPSTPAPSTPTTPIAHVTPEPVSSCCSKKSPPSTVTSTPASSITALSFIPAAMDSPPPLLLPLEPVPLPDIPPPSSCCGPPSKNQQGETIRVVTCRCGDSCACIGCDAHPSRAMKEGKNDVYIGFDTSVNSSKRRLSIAAICATTSSSSGTTKVYAPPQQQQQQDHPTSILAEDGTVLCGCGCSRAFADCSDCFRELCDGYFN